jgi:hypothetical protein
MTEFDNPIQYTLLKLLFSNSVRWSNFIKGTQEIIPTNFYMIIIRGDTGGISNLGLNKPEIP